MKTLKLLISTLAPLLISALVFAQAPDKSSYQAVIRDAAGKLVTSQPVGMRVSILQGGETGTAVYVETHTDTTNNNGLVSITIGSGTPVTGIFAAINWATGPYFLKTETDPAGGTNYAITGTSQLLSVPYALHARTAGNGFSGNYNDLSNKPMLFDGTWASLTGKPTSIAGYGITDAVKTTGNQTIAGNKTFSGTTTVAPPVNATDAATKAYVDAIKSSIFEELLNAGLNGIVQDVDGNTYKTIKIGNQIWMTENLKTTKYNDGTAIPNVTDATAWEALTTGAYCDYNNTPSISTIYGKLYNYYTVDDARRLCPIGWHIPTDDDCVTLITYLGGQTVAGGKLKEPGTSHWTTPNTDADNSTGFTALPDGRRGADGTFDNIGDCAYLWSSAEFNTLNAWYRIIYYNSSSVNKIATSKRNGLSVRCLRD